MISRTYMCAPAPSPDAIPICSPTGPYLRQILETLPVASDLLVRPTPNSPLIREELLSTFFYASMQLDAASGLDRDPRQIEVNRLA